MRICLLTGGGYPFRRDALGGWCRTLVDGLGRFTFDLLTITDREPPGGPAYPLPGHVASATAVPLGPQGGRREHDDDATAAAVLLCRGLLSEPEPGAADAMFAQGLRGLSGSAGQPLHAVPLTDVVLEAWRAGRDTATEDRLPRLGVRDARTAAALLRHAARALSVPVPGVDLVHCVGGTTPLLAALAGRWRTGMPLLLTEARAPVARPRAGEDRLSPAVRTVLRRFRRAVARTGYAEAGLIAPLSAYQDHCVEQVDRTGLGRAVRLHPLPADPRNRYAAGHLVVHVPGPADPPYRLIEAMMSGRAVIGADVGPVAETLGDGGVLVAPDDPAALAEACLKLLRAPARRRALGDAARRRALACFTADRVVRVYDALYTDLAGPAPALSYELALAVPAPRAAWPTTLRWLAEAGEER